MTFKIGNALGASYQEPINSVKSFLINEIQKERSLIRLEKKTLVIAFVRPTSIIFKLLRAACELVNDLNCTLLKFENCLFNELFIDELKIPRLFSSPKCFEFVNCDLTKEQLEHFITAFNPEKVELQQKKDHGEILVFIHANFLNPQQTKSFVFNGVQFDQPEDKKKMRDCIIKQSFENAEDDEKAGVRKTKDSLIIQPSQMITLGPSYVTALRDFLVDRPIQTLAFRQCQFTLEAIKILLDSRLDFVTRLEIHDALQDIAVLKYLLNRIYITNLGYTHLVLDNVGIDDEVIGLVGFNDLEYSNVLEELHLQNNKIELRFFYLALGLNNCFSLKLKVLNVLNNPIPSHFRRKFGNLLRLKDVILIFDESHLHLLDQNTTVKIPSSSIVVHRRGEPSKEQLRTAISLKSNILAASAPTQEMMVSIKSLHPLLQSECFEAMLSLKYIFVFVEGDGSCLFHSFSKFFETGQNAYIRNLVLANYLRLHKGLIEARHAFSIKDYSTVFREIACQRLKEGEYQEFMEIQPTEEDLETNSEKVDNQALKEKKLKKYTQEMQGRHEWAGFAEIAALVEVFSISKKPISVAVFTPLCPPKVIDGEILPPEGVIYRPEGAQMEMRLHHANGNHYEILVPKGDAKKA